MSFRFLTAGESHGKALVGIIEGLPSGLEVTQEQIHTELKRRKIGFGRGARQKIEDDCVEILSGVRHGQTLGSPISLLIWNKDWSAWKDIMQAEPFSGEVRRKVEIPRPGHADWVGSIKYQHEDMRNVLERSSARETAMRVAVGSICRLFLKKVGIQLASRVIRIGEGLDEAEMSHPLAELNQRADESPVRCTGKVGEAAMINAIENAQKTGDTLGGVFEVFAWGAPLGLGSFVQWDRRIEAEIGRAFLSLNAIKGVETGLGFDVGRRLGSQVHDEYYAGANHYKTNHSGGIDGGMTTGQPLVIRAAMKPLATLMSPLNSIDPKTGTPAKAHVERSDVCAVPAAAVIGESLLALALTPHVLEKFGGDSMDELLVRIESWRGSCGIG